MLLFVPYLVCFPGILGRTYCSYSSLFQWYFILFLFEFFPGYFRENRAKCGSVCVANHTTPIDIIMLAGDNCFTLVRTGGVCVCALTRVWGCVCHTDEARG